MKICDRGLTPPCDIVDPGGSPPSESSGVMQMADDFFTDIEQVEINVAGGTAKFPIFYRDARMFTIMLPAKVMKLRRMLPDTRFVPAQMLPGVGGLALTAFEYYDTDVQPYNEFSIGILLNSPYYAPVPCYNAIRQYLARMYSIFIHHLPVTTEIALRGGIDFYNYPKFLADIDFSDTSDLVTCDLARDGERILTMSGEKLYSSALGEMKFLCNLYHYRQPQLAEFKLNVVEGAIRWLPQNVSWAFNPSSSIGRELCDVVIGNRALMYLYMPKIQCVLYGPEALSFPLIHRALELQGVTVRKAPAKKPAAGKKTAKKPAKKPAKPA